MHQMVSIPVDTSRRWWVLAIVVAAQFMFGVDAFIVNVAIPTVAAELHASPAQIEAVIAIYLIAYATLVVTGGRLGDIYGTKNIFLAGVSGFTATSLWCGLSQSGGELIAARLAQGATAALMVPQVLATLHLLFADGARARAFAIYGIVLGLAGAVGFLLGGVLVAFDPVGLGWRAVFLILGVAGFLWAMSWQRLIRDRPAEQPGISAAELVEIGATPPPSHDGTPWKKLARLPQLWLIAAAYGMYGSGPWFYFSWFPTWLVKSAGFSIREMGVYASLPFFLGVAANLAGGQICDRLALHLGMRRAYAGMSCVCLLLTGLIMMALSVVHTKWMIIVLASLGFGAMDLMLPCAWSMCMAIGGRVGGTATAVMNTVGNLGGLFCTFGFGYILEATGSYEIPVRAVAIMVILSGLIFSTIDCGRGLDAEFAARPL